jgi:hypothetical protein
VYDSNIQLLKFSTFTGIFESHLRLDLWPQPQPQWPLCKDSCKDVHCTYFVKP